MSATSAGIGGKVAVVTGASGGIGRAIVEVLRAEGAEVAGFDTEPGAPPGDVASCLVDVSDADAVEQAVEGVEHSLGPIEIVVNAAGVLRVGPADQLPARDVDLLTEVNFRGVVNVSRATTRRMRLRAAGALVTVASNAGSIPRVGMALYGATKAAAIHYTRALGLELAPVGIRCNVVSPGSTDTTMLRSLWEGPADLATVLNGSTADFRPGIPLGKLATPHDVAEAVAFLVSPCAGHITMHDLCVDGGASLGS